MVFNLLHLGFVTSLMSTRPGLILIVNHDYIYSIEIFFNQNYSLIVDFCD